MILGVFLEIILKKYSQIRTSIMFSRPSTRAFCWLNYNSIVIIFDTVNSVTISRDLGCYIIWFDQSDIESSISIR